jgi:HlyD family secretion protein
VFGPPEWRLRGAAAGEEVRAAMKSKGIVRKSVPWVVAVVVLATGAYWWTRRGDGESETKFRVEKAERGSINETVAATGTLSAVTTVQVGSQVSGIVSRLHADFNSGVARGQLVAELDPTPFLATLDQRRADLVRAEVQARSAQIAFERQSRLLEQGLTSQAEYDLAKADFEAASAQVDQARAAARQAETNLAYTRIMSPIDGVVVDRQYDVGQTVAASFQAPTLFTIAQDLTKMQVQADVDQADIGKIQVGQKASFSVDAYPDTTFEGQITQIRLNATVNQNVISYPVIITVGNPEQKLRPKMTANVTIVVATEPDVLRVPNAALRFRPVETGPPGSGDSAGRPKDAERAAADMGRGTRGLAAADELMRAAGGGGKGGRRKQNVYKPEGAGGVKAVPVRTGITDGRFTAILEGEIEPGDEVVVGLATSKVEGTGSFPGAGPTGPSRGGGGRRM